MASDIAYTVDDRPIPVTVADRRRALSTFLNMSKKHMMHRGRGKFQLYDCEYLVLTDAEADARAEERIRETADENHIFINIDSVVREMLAERGRAYFLACDDDECEESGFFIYRVN